MTDTTKTLVIETSSKHLYVMLLDGTKTYKQVLLNCQKQHSVILNDTIQAVLNLANLELKDIDVFAVGIGVGSFTGIRVGVSVVKAFNMIFNKKLIQVNSLTTLAYTKQGRTNCLADSGKGWYYAVYDGIEQIVSPTLLPVEQAQDILTSPDTVIFDPTMDYSQQIEAQVRQKLLKQEYSTKLTPLYIRKPQAEEQKNDR